MKIKSESVTDTEKLGHLLGKLLGPDDVICLIGGLGAGKTAFTRGLSKGWGSHSRVTSPTFTLINEYTRTLDTHIMYHLDCYRLGSEDDVETIGLEDILNTQGPTVIEWPDIASDWIPDDHIQVNIEPFTTTADVGRWFTFSASGPSSKLLIKSLGDTLNGEVA